MSGLELYAASIAVYAIPPLLLVALPRAYRFMLLYTYLAGVLVLAGFLGSVYALPLGDGVAISAGQVAYGAFIFGSMLTAIAVRDVQVLRDVAAIVISVNVINVGIFALSGAAIGSGEVLDATTVAPSLFGDSVRIVISGAVLAILELAILVSFLEAAKRQFTGTRMIKVYIGAYLAVIVLDGVLFPLLMSPLADGLGAAIAESVRGKAILALSYAVFLGIFLLMNRRALDQYEATPLHVREFLFSSRHQLLGELDRQSELRERRSTTARDLAALDSGGSVREVLARLGTVLEPLPGVRTSSVGLRARLEDDTVMAYGRLHGEERGTAAAIWPARADTDPAWVEDRPVGTVACIALRQGDETIGVLDVPVDVTAADDVVAELADVAPQMTVLLRPHVEAASSVWADRVQLRRVIDEEAIEIVFQPIIELATGDAVGVEGLSRFTDGQPTLPRFREAERVGLSIELELLAARHVLAAAASLPDDLTVTLNVSGETALTDEFRDLVSACDRRLVLEFTEHRPIADYDELRVWLTSMGGPMIAVDDAGSGYATLAHVLRLVPNVVKLDRSWVTAIETDRPRQVLVSGLVQLARELDATLVAEGIETAAEAEALEAIGVRYAQGFYFGRPVPGDELDLTVTADATM